ncbi:MAG: hypothetical protein BWY83_02898 [bacterium ADurb.Bin478]|nr:MAG: hypothetical protein BWY83_02898 [bacterium ADurb.Bin478]
MHHAAGQVVDRRGIGQAADLHIAKAVEGEAGFIGLGPSPAEHIDIGVQGFFVAGEIQHAVCLQVFGIAQGHALAAPAVTGHAHPAAEILSQVIHRQAGGGKGQGDGFELLGDLDIRHERVGQNAAGRFHHAGMRPAAVVETGLAPAGRFLGGVIHFAVIDAGEQNRARRGPPIAVADDHLGGAVAVIDMQLHDRTFGAEPLHAIGVPPFFIGIEPAVAEH